MPFNANQLQRAVAGRDHERRKRQDLAGFAAAALRRRRVRLGPPDDERRPADIGERAGIRIGDGADEVVDLRARLLPVDAAVIRFAGAELGGLRFILRPALDGTADERIELSFENSAREWE